MFLHNCHPPNDHDHRKGYDQRRYALLDRPAVPRELRYTDGGSTYADTSTIRFDNKVSVLAFHWDNDNMNVVPSEQELLMSSK
jgi:hypothetical protein